MEVEKLKAEILMLPKDDRERLLREIGDLDAGSVVPKAQASRRHLLDSMMGCCPHSCSLPQIRTV